MSLKKSLSTAVVAIAIIPAYFGVVSVSAFAQASPAPQVQPEAEHYDHPRHIEGRLAFLKTELKITDAQSTQWTAFADVLRQTAEAHRQRIKEFRAERAKDLDHPKTVVERLEAGQHAAEDRAHELSKVASALRPLYASLSDDQKKTADELLGHFAGGRSEHRGHFSGGRPDDK